MASATPTAPILQEQHPRRSRQVIVTHIETGIETVVLGVQRCYGLHLRNHWWLDRELAARAAGLRWPADCTVRVVPFGEEYRLGFDVLPLQIGRRAS